VFPNCSLSLSYRQRRYRRRGKRGAQLRSVGPRMPNITKPCQSANFKDTHHNRVLPMRKSQPRTPNIRESCQYAKVSQGKMSTEAQRRPATTLHVLKNHLHNSGCSTPRNPQQLLSLGRPVIGRSALAWGCATNETEEGKLLPSRNREDAEDVCKVGWYAYMAAVLAVIQGYLTYIETHPSRTLP